MSSESDGVARAIDASEIYVSYVVRSARRSNAAVRTVEALRGVSFHVDRGESVGLIGPNGAGKSTLMNVMAGVLTPDRGEVWASAEPAVMSVSGLLTARYTGRRNVELALLAQGWHPKRISNELPSLVEFAELGPAIDRPIGSYLSLIHI